MKIYKEYYDNNERNKTHKYYNDKISSDTMRYQKKYNFELNQRKGHETWNCEADAFKHAYGSALMTLDRDELFSILAGWQHEKVTQNNPINEYEMDTHNNNVGRQVAKEIKNSYKGNWNKLSKQQQEDIIADRVWKHMRAGDLILDPSGRRTLKNSGKSGVSTGQAVNLSEEEREMLERYARENEMFAPENRVFYENEMNPAQVPSNSSENNYVQAFVKQYLNNNKKLPTENELKQRVISGELVYVHNYERQDGTKVSGYYRSKPSR